MIVIKTAVSVIDIKINFRMLPNVQKSFICQTPNLTHKIPKSFTELQIIIIKTVCLL